MGIMREGRRCEREQEGNEEIYIAHKTEKTKNEP